jgi:hypothetical protein
MLGLVALIPVAMLLTVSFFVLFTRQKTEDANLKAFGLGVAILLWVVSAVILGAGITTMTCCRHHSGYGKMGMMMDKEEWEEHGMQGMCAPGMKCAPGMQGMMEQKGGKPQAAPVKEEQEK